MPAVNFQKRFADAVESGEKRQTIRAYRRDGRDPKPGDTLHLFTGMRTRQCRKLGEQVCVDVTPILIGPSGIALHPYTDECLARTPVDADTEAVADGFESFAAMRAWFEKTHGLPFNGLRISW